MSSFSRVSGTGIGLAMRVSLLSMDGGFGRARRMDSQITASTSIPATPIPLGEPASCARVRAGSPPPSTMDGTPACLMRWRPVRRMPRHELHLRHPLPRRRPRAGRRAGGARPGGAWRGVDGGRRRDRSRFPAHPCRAGHRGPAFRPRGGSGGGRGRPARRSRRPVRRPRRAPLRTCRPCRRRAGSARLPALGTEPSEPPSRRLRLCSVGRREAHPFLRPGPRGDQTLLLRRHGAGVRLRQHRGRRPCRTGGVR